ncbi:ribosome-binding protein [Entomophthora muscae]|uniref:Ribosome-binding protein n=1 Tax=Entomophthora muscae TaxID=34485 RepID=A0ACC2SMV5_9FUNG|nr:ribosome-binding protein [Entomophthora muscae]
MWYGYPTQSGQHVASTASRNDVDITDGIPKNSTLHFCRNCDRYLQPPCHWVLCALESRELLALCLKKLKGLKAVRLIDAGFIWTEPHSKRIKTKLTIQKEAFASTILQQTFEVEFVVANQMCEDCTKIMAKNTWKASVQVRQKVPHKRTFLYLEQLILKHNVHKDTTNIKEARDGIDFYYVQRGHAIKMCDFLMSVVPAKIKASEQLISTDTHSGSSNYKFTYSVEIAPVCKDDLVCLPVKTARSLGSISPLVVCTRISNSIHVIDPLTLATAEVNGLIYHRHPFGSLCTSSSLTEFVVLDIEIVGAHKGKFVLADVQVARVQDYGKNDTVFFTRTHLGGILHFGDLAYGYDLNNSNLNDESFDKLNSDHIPNIVLIKKSYSNRRRKPRPRHWKVKSLVKEEENLTMRRLDKEKADTDYEMFLRDIEEDPEFRASINLYKEEKAARMAVEGPPMDDIPEDHMSDQDELDLDDLDDAFPEIKLEELLDDLHIDDEQDQYAVESAQPPNELAAGDLMDD